MTTIKLVTPQQLKPKEKTIISEMTLAEKDALLVKYFDLMERRRVATSKYQKKQRDAKRLFQTVAGFNHTVDACDVDN